MKLFDRFKGKHEQPEQKVQAKVVKNQAAKSQVAAPSKKIDQPKAVAAETKSQAKKTELSGKSLQAHQVLVKPLITEKAAELGALNKYVFVVNPKMNKVEIKKAIRTIYKVDPTQVNILNFSGKKVRYGRTIGTTKHWKKAVVTLKPGDKIEVYEGV